VARLLRPLLAFLGVHLVLGALFFWVAQLYSNILMGVGGRLENLPLQTRGPLVLAQWIVASWPVLLLVAVILAVLYALAVTPPEGKRPRGGLVVFLWLPLVFAYGVLLWLIVAQRQPINTLRSVTGGGITEAPPAAQSP